MLRAPRPRILSPQQARVFSLLARGFVYIEIAERMRIDKSTVKLHAGLARDKLGAATMFEAAVKAEGLGEILGDDEIADLLYPVPHGLGVS